jgi:telomere length regulation protein
VRLFQVVICCYADPFTETNLSLTFCLTKLVNVGVFVSTSSTSPSQPSFWKSTLPIIRRRLGSEDHTSYSLFLSDVIQSIPSALTQQAILGSLLASLKQLAMKLDPSSHQRALVKREASMLRSIIGPLNAQSQELWENMSAVILNRQWDEGRARMIVCWIAGFDSDALDTEGNISSRPLDLRHRASPLGLLFPLALGFLLSRLLDVWSSPEHVKHSLLAQHQCQSV